MNVLLMMERRLSSQIITILLDKIEKLTREKAIVDAELKLTKENINDFKVKYQAMKREGNALKRYNSRLVFNSFISDLTEIPKKDGNSQVRIKQIYRDYSNNSMKNMWYEYTKEQEKEPASSCLKIYKTLYQKDNEGHTPFSNDNSFVEADNIELNQR